MNDQPNILILMTDQQRYDSMGCYGFDAAHTPNLDRLAKEGALFDRCYVTNPICTPSRSSMFTGKHLHGHGVYTVYGNLPDDEILFTEHLQNAGYETALFGKMHIRSRMIENTQRHPHDGFDIYEWSLEASLDLDSPLNGYGAWLKEKDPDFFELLKRDGRKVLHHPRELHFTTWAAERTIDYIKNRRDRTKPFFAMMSIFDPHNPYEDWPEEMADHIDESMIPDPLVIDGEMENMPRGIRQEHEGCYLGPFNKYSTDDLRKMRRGYHASIALADLEMGRVLDTLREEGLEENTLVIFVSDHGDMLGDHGLLVKGAFFFDPNIRVPLIMRWPERFDGGNRVQSLVQIQDIAATILTAAGLETDAVREHAPDAGDLSPLAASERDRIRDWAACIYRNTGIKEGGMYFDPEIHATMFMDERYKLSLYHDIDSTGPHGRPIAQMSDTQGTHRPQGTLYDMQSDPDETVNLWSDPVYRDIRIGLTRRMLDWSVSQEVRYGRRGPDHLPSPAQQVMNTANP
jgi:arylsulfatase